MKADRRDANESDLVKLARSLGVTWLDEGPLDGWAWVARMAKWAIVEIKNPEVEGRAREYTPKQRRIFRLFSERGIPWFIWRTPDDVLRDLGARRCA